MAETGMDVHIQDRRGALDLRVSFHLEVGWTVLFGPSGSGKSTVLRIIAGLERPKLGKVVLGGKSLTDTEHNVSVPPHRRGVRMVAQRPGLFPDKDVHANMRFGCAEQNKVTEVAHLCRVEALLKRKVQELSGGERQRVALARTLAAEGMRCLLLDEPFSGLDGVLRDEMLTDLKAWLAPKMIPILLVTHDAGEVLASGARVIRLRAGHVVARGLVEEVLAPELGLLRRGLEMGVERR